MAISSVAYGNPQKNSFIVVDDGISMFVSNDPNNPERQLINEWVKVPGNNITDFVADVPSSVSNYQARTLLIELGLFSMVDKALRGADSSITANQIALTAWDYANDYYRNSAFVEAMGAVLNLSDKQIDDMFIAASKIL